MPSEAAIISKERKALMKQMDSGPHRIPRREVDENVLIASWNIAQFSNNKKTVRSSTLPTFASVLISLPSRK